MAKFFFPKFLDRIKLIGSAGSIKPGDWDKQLNICIMQALELKEKLDRDQLDPLSAIKQGNTTTLSDRVSTVDPEINAAAIGLNDRCTGTERQELVQYLPAIGDSKGSTAKTQAIQEYTKSKGYGNASAYVQDGYQKGGMNEALGRFEEILEIQDPSPVAQVV